MHVVPTTPVGTKVILDDPDYGPIELKTLCKPFRWTGGLWQVEVSQLGGVIPIALLEVVGDDTTEDTPPRGKEDPRIWRRLLVSYLLQQERPAPGATLMWKIKEDVSNYELFIDIPEYSDQ